MKKLYGKMVRDKVPEIMKKEGCTGIITKTLDIDDYEKALALKLEEEAKEAAVEVRLSDREAVIEELADLKEVMLSISTYMEITEEEMEAYREKKKELKGGFVEGIWLESAEV